MGTRNFEDKIKIPVLMYHEVSREIAETESYKMVPLYNISERQFEDQIRALSEDGYRSVFFEDVTGLPPKGKYVILTFDDGLIGNVRVALPILKKYDFKAVFFIAVGLIGSSGYMDWADLLELRDSGMSVQSHAMSHRSLQTLSDSEVAHEMQQSKSVLENGLARKVTALSFPHGSYDMDIIKSASEAGYEFLCTSEFVRNFSTLFGARPVVLGRVAVTTKVDLARFLKLVEYDRISFLNVRLAKGAKNLFKRIVGINNYRRLYRLFFNIKPSS